MITDKMVEAALVAANKLALHSDYPPLAEDYMRAALQAAEDAREATAEESSGVASGWSGWAVQYPGEMPKLYGAREIAELNYYPEEGARLIHLMEAAPRSGDTPVAPVGFRVARGGQWLFASTAYDAALVENHRNAGATVELLYAAPVSYPAYAREIIVNIVDGPVIGPLPIEAMPYGGLCVHVPADARDAGQDERDREVGRKWRTNSALEEWFPLTADQLARAEAGARRYRWLRQPGRQIHHNTTPSQPWCVRVESDQGLPVVRPIDGTDLDAAIDRAMGAEGGDR